MTELLPKRDGFAHDIDRENGKEEWLTPPVITQTLGPFDLDPCSPIKRPWSTAKNHFTIEDNGLMKPWQGLVWCNPPYGNKTGDWLKRCAEHGDALVLIFARTETAAFHEWVWPYAKSLFFLKGRLSFFHVTGKPGGGIRCAIGFDCLRRRRGPAAARPGQIGRLVCGEQKEPRGVRREWLHRIMTKAIYIRREDGDYDFVAAFGIDALPAYPSDWVGEIVEWIKEENEDDEVVVIEADLPFLPNILDGDSYLIPGNPSPGEKIKENNL